MSMVSGLFLAAAIAAGTAVAALADVGDTTGIYGLVKDYATGQPIAGAKVNLIEAKTMNPDPLRDSIVTGPDGSFRFTGLTSILEKAFGYVLQARSDRYWVVSTDLVQLSAGEMKRFDLICRKQVSLHVSLRDSTGIPSSFPDAHVVLKTMPRYESPKAAETDSSGRTLFGELMPGPVGVSVSMEGYRTRYLSGALDGSVWNESLSVALEKLPAGGGKTIRGKLKDQDGKYVNGFTVFFTYDAPEGRPILFGKSGLGGSFGIGGIPDTCGSGILFSDRLTDSIAVALAGGETELNFQTFIPGVLDAVPPRNPGTPAMRARLWYMDFNLLGRRKRAGK